MGLNRRVLDAVRPADRLIVAVIGAFNLFMGWRLFDITTGVPMEEIWPFVFLAAGLACFLLELRFLNRDLLAWSGALTSVAYASRAAVLAVALSRGEAKIADQRVQAGIAIWLLLTIVTGYIWVRVLRPLLELRRFDA
jgi:hypothetical protein